jgi:hypothetical protein
MRCCERFLTREKRDWFRDELEDREVLEEA